MPQSGSPSQREGVRGREKYDIKGDRINTLPDTPPKTTKQGMLQRLKKHAMSPESLKKFDEGRKAFRDNFVMKA
jgi:hypothetical protein